MALSRSHKNDLVGQYTEGLAAAPHAFLVSYKGITVPQVTDLRSRIRETGGSYEVVKNTLALIAVDGKDMGQLKEHFVGPTAVAYHAEDPVGLAKVLSEFTKEVPTVEIKAGIVEGQVVSADQVQDIANMPSKEELLVKVLYLLQSPVTRFVRVLAALPRSLVIALDQVAQKKGDG